jgi:hypothetical protein
MGSDPAAVPRGLNQGEDAMKKLIDLGLSDPNKALQDLLVGILTITGGNDFDVSVANVHHAAVTLFEIADRWIKVTDADAVDALKGVLFDVCCLRNDGSVADVFPEGTDEAVCPLITPANLHAAARVLMHVADVHDDAVI